MAPSLQWPVGLRSAETQGGGETYTGLPNNTSRRDAKWCGSIIRPTLNDVRVGLDERPSDVGVAEIRRGRYKDCQSSAALSFILALLRSTRC